MTQLGVLDLDAFIEEGEVRFGDISKVEFKEGNGTLSSGTWIGEGLRLVALVIFEGCAGRGGHGGGDSGEG